MHDGPRMPPNPLAAWSEFVGQTVSQWILPLAEASKHQRFARFYTLFQQAIGSLGKPAFDIGCVKLNGCAVPVLESVVLESPFCQLRGFACRRPRNGQAAPTRRVLLCAPLAGHHAVLMREVVETLLPDADIYVTDWSDARDVPADAGAFRLEDYVLLLRHFMTELDPSRLDVLAICQAAVPALAAATCLASAGDAEPRTLMLMGGPVDPRLDPTALGRIAACLSLQWLETMAIDAVPAGYPGAGRRVYPGFLQYPALVAAQPDRHFSLMIDYLYNRSVGDAQAVCEIERSMKHYARVLDMPAEFFTDTLRVVFQQALLPKGLWRVAGRPVRPDCLRTTRLLTVEGDSDSITGRGQTHAAHDLCRGLPPARRRQVTIARCDHYGLFSGPRWHTDVYPAIRAWIDRLP